MLTGGSRGPCLNWTLEQAAGARRLFELCPGVARADQEGRPCAHPLGERGRGKAAISVALHRGCEVRIVH